MFSPWRLLDHAKEGQGVFLAPIQIKTTESHRHLTKQVFTGPTNKIQTLFALLVHRLAFMIFTVYIKDTICKFAPLEGAY